MVRALVCETLGGLDGFEFKHGDKKKIIVHLTLRKLDSLYVSLVSFYM